MDCVIYLQRAEKVTDKYGVEHFENPETAGIYADVQSVTRQEFFAGGRSGMNPEYMFTVFHADYHGEPIVFYDGRPYAVYRTYHRDDDYMEIYVRREGGANGQNHDG